MSALLDSPTRAGTLPCGCEWRTTWAPGVANLHEYTRRCKVHAPSKRPKKAKPRKALAMRRNRYADESRARTQAQRYAEAMGRPWADPAPNSTDFGSPTYPDDVRFGDPGWEGAYQAWDAAHKVWLESEAHAEFQRLWATWHARREQFEYTGRGRGHEKVIEQARVSA